MKPGALRVLVADDEAAQRSILREILADEGHAVTVAGDGAAALALLQEEEFDLLLSDLRMPNVDGHELVRQARRLQPELTIILMTAYGTVASAVEAMKDGAYDYLQKPFAKGELVQRVSRVAERAGLVRENRRLRQRLQQRERPRLLGDSPAMQRLRQQLARVASRPEDVLVTGESGTGKELIARLLHEMGPWPDGPFVAVNCAAIPEGIAESELFGHEKGAFTHATAVRAGRFEQAEDGTLFLDEISSMPLPLQAKLLRVLQDRLVERVGARRARRIAVRVIAASNRDLPALVARGEFRADLYHRLNVLEVHVPPLRDRRGDVSDLARAFAAQAAHRAGLPPPELADDLMDFLLRYEFPGNVRELEHLMTKMVVLAEGSVLRLADLPPSLASVAAVASAPGGAAAGIPWSAALGAAAATAVPGVGSDAAAVPALPPEALLAHGPISLEEVEERLLREAIRLAGGNLSEAARRLGLSYKTLRYRAGKLRG